MRVWPDQVVDADDDGQGVGPKEDAEEVEEEQGDVDPASNVAYCNVHLSWVGKLWNKLTNPQNQKRVKSF